MQLFQKDKGNRESYIKKGMKSVYTGKEEGYGSQRGICICILAQCTIQGTEHHFPRLDKIEVDFSARFLVQEKFTTTPCENVQWYFHFVF